MLLNILIFFFTYIIASDLLFLVLLRLLKSERRLSVKHIFFLSRGLGPIVISWLLYNLFLLLPQRPPWLYVSLVLLFFAIVLWATRKQLPQLTGIYSALFQAIPNLRHLSSLCVILLCLIVLVGLFIFVIGIGFPIVSHDALVFAVEARLIHRDLSLDHYPPLEPDLQTGYYENTFMVPALQMLYVWFFLATGTSQMDLLVRTVAPMYGVYCLLLVWYVAHRKDATSALWGAFILMTTPLFVSQSYYNSQDPMRIYFVLAALVWLAELLKSEKSGLAIAVGIFSGLAFFSHFFGALTLLTVILLYFLLSSKAPSRRILTVLLILSIAFVAGAAYHYASPPVAGRLMRQFNLVPVPKKGLSSWLLSPRGQESPFKTLVLGRLQMFTGIQHFGFTFYLLLGFLWHWLRYSHKSVLDKVLVGSALIFAIAVLSGVRELSWSNPRYIGSLMPVCAYFGGFFLSSIMTRINCSLRLKMPSLAPFFTILLLISPLIAVTTVRGAKLGITNPGDFYERLYSLEWVRAVLNDPTKAMHDGWQHYVGLKDTIEYIESNDHIKLQHSHDVFATIEYVNTRTEKDALCLVFRGPRYFYYAERKGLAVDDPRLKPFLQITDTEEACNYLLALDVDYVLIDTYYERHPLYAQTELINILSDRWLSSKVYEYRSARVHRLTCNRQ